MAADFSAVGLGSGSPGSISREAIDCLRSADEIFCPRSRSATSSHAHGRLDDIDRFDAKIIEYPLAMKSGGEDLREDYVSAAGSIGESVENDRDVAAVTVGDPFLYSTLGPLVEAVSERLPSDCIRTVPGISSIQAAAVRLNRPLVQRDQQFGLIPLRSGCDLSPDLFGRFQTIAFTKVNRDFERLWTRLKTEGRLDTSYLLERLGSDRETVRQFSEIDATYNSPYFSLVLSFEEPGPWD